MRALFATFVASLVVVFALFVLVSEDQTSQGRSGLTVHEERVSGLSFLESILLQRQRKAESTSSTSTIVQAQQILQEDGFYSGPLDGAMSERTRDALRCFQKSKQISVTGKIDDETVRHLGIK